MLTYILVNLAENSASFCQYQSKNEKGEVMSLDTLDSLITWSLMENVYLQFIYPVQPLSSEYYERIRKIPHADIVSLDCEDSELFKRADVIIIDNIEGIQKVPKEVFDKSFILKVTFSELFNNEDKIINLFRKVSRLNILIKDIQNFNEKVEKKYRSFLNQLIIFVKEQFYLGNCIQSNILTDRIFLNNMNNCNAGIDSLSFAPNGKFYICPAFYFEDENNSIGDLKTGIKIKGKRLFKIENAPICSLCDAFQCRRCVWLNKKFTNEFNTPGKEQCIIAHLERNASRKLYPLIRNFISVQHKIEIPKIDYLDPFVLANKW